MFRVPAAMKYASEIQIPGPRIGAKEQICTDKSKYSSKKTSANNSTTSSPQKNVPPVFFHQKFTQAFWQETTRINVKSTLHGIRWRTAHHGFCLFKGHLEVICRGLDIPLVCLRILPKKTQNMHFFQKEKNAGKKKLSRMLLFLAKKKTLNIFCDNGHFGDFGNVAYFEMKLPKWHFCWMASSIKLPRLAATSCPSTPWSHRPVTGREQPAGWGDG